MPPRRQPRAANHDDDGTDLAELRCENAEFHRDNDDLRWHVELLTQQINESVYMRRHDDDDVTVTDDNPFAGRRNRSPVRPSQRWEQGFKVEIPKFDGSLKPEEFIDWLSQVEEILDFKEVPKECRISLVTIRLHGQSAAFLPYNFKRDLYQQFQNLRQGSRSVDEYSTEFYTFLARVDLNESPIQLVSRYIGGMRLQLQDVLNMFDPLTVAEAQQCASQGRTGGLRCFNCGEAGHRQVNYQNSKSSNRGLFTEDNESKSVLIIDSTSTYDDYANTDEEYVSGDVGPLLVLRRSCLTRRAPNDEWLRDNLFHSTCTIGGKVCTFIIDAGSCENMISKVAVSKLSLSTEPHPKPYRLSWLCQENIERFLNRFTDQPNETSINDPESDDGSVDTPLVSPFPHSDNDSEDKEVLNELSEYENAGTLRRERIINSFDEDDLAFECMIGFMKFTAYLDPFLPMNIISRKAYNTIMVDRL
ncbi:putative reverse transcriptase domain-containing protein [Tanacetum coccineum]